jgi:hypothetical protein
LRLGEKNVAFHRHPEWIKFRDGRLKARARIQRVAAEKRGSGDPRRNGAGKRTGITAVGISADVVKQLNQSRGCRE